jgi:hypothetical protein
LYSVGVGVVLALLDLLQVALCGPSSSPFFPRPLVSLMGAFPIISAMLVAFGAEVMNCLLIFFVLFLARVALRKEWLAVVVAIAIVTGIDYAPGRMHLADLPFEIALLGILTVVMLRFGLVAAIFGYATKAILNLPHTLDFSAWYSPTTAVPLILLPCLQFTGSARRSAEDG